MRPRTIVALGTTIGLAIAVAAAIGDQIALHQGQNPASVGFNSSHGLFLIGLPWSAGVAAIMWGVLGLANSDGAAAMRPFFYAMPIVAGLGWSAVVAVIVDWKQVRRQSSRPAV